MTAITQSLPQQQANLSNAYQALQPAVPNAEESSTTAEQLSLYLTLYIDILEAANNQDLPVLNVQLVQFKRLLTSQLAEAYRELLKLQKMGYSNSEAASAKWDSYTNMVSVIGAILPILNRYDSTRLGEQSLALLTTDLERVGGLLMAYV